METNQVAELVKTIIQAKEANDETVTVEGTDYSLNQQEMTPRLAAIDDLYHVFAGERQISDENLLMNTTNIKQGVAVIQLDIHCDTKTDGAEKLTIDINRYQSEEQYQNSPLTVYEVQLKYESHVEKLAERYQQQFADRLQLEDKEAKGCLGITFARAE